MVSRFPLDMPGAEPWRSVAYALLHRHGVEVSRWRKDMTGVAFHWLDEIEAPVPKTAKSFAVLAHEIGHKALHACNGRYPRWREEVEAWDFALAAFREFGLRTPRPLILWIERRVARAVYRARVADRDGQLRQLRRDYPRWGRRILGAR